MADKSCLVACQTLNTAGMQELENKFSLINQAMERLIQEQFVCFMLRFVACRLSKRFLFLSS